MATATTTTVAMFWDLKPAALRKTTERLRNMTGPWRPQCPEPNRRDDEFLRMVRGEMNPTRKKIALKAFAIMDKDGSGTLDINDIRGTYNAKQHPDVKAGKKTEDEILGEFLDTFEDHWNDVKGNPDSRDGRINQQEWLEYYNNVSMSIDRDDYF